MVRPQALQGGRGGGGRGTGIATLLLAVWLAAALLLAAAKLVRRGLRFLTRDPRGIAGAVRRDLVGFMADQGVAVPASATPTELGAILERRFGVDSSRLVEVADARPLRPARGGRCRCPTGATRAPPCAEGDARPAERAPPGAWAREPALPGRLRPAWT